MPKGNRGEASGALQEGESVSGVGGKMRLVAYD